MCSWPARASRSGRSRSARRPASRARPGSGSGGRARSARSSRRLSARSRMGPRQGLASRLRRGTRPVRHDEPIDDDGPALARERGPDLAAFYDRRAAAALAYCARLCPPEAIADAVEASFARVFEAAAGGEATDEEALDRSLRAAVRTQAAARTSAATTGIPARRVLERLADPNRGGACELMPALLVARAGGTLSEGDRDRIQAHLRRCADCRAVEQRFEEAERSYDALIGSHAPALG